MLNFILVSIFSLFRLVLYNCKDLCEVFGKKKASIMVIFGFLASILSLLFINLAVILPGSEVWINNSLGYDSVKGMQNAYESVFTLPGFLISASMLPSF